MFRATDDFEVARQDLGLKRTFIAHPGTQRYRRHDGAEVIPLVELVNLLADEADNGLTP